jgi:hypothetical protein
MQFSAANWLQELPGRAADRVPLAVILRTRNDRTQWAALTVLSITVARDTPSTTLSQRGIGCRLLVAWRIGKSNGYATM